jgi:hypothetical protein
MGELSAKMIDNLEISDAEAAERAYLASILRRANRAGLQMMHRRKGQYWLMYAEPMTVWQIDCFLSNNKL